MQVLLNAEQIRSADLHTIKNKSISSLELMESAAQAFVNRFIHYEQNLSTCISVCCGKGNNGGDGLAIARLLYNLGYINIKVYLINFIGSSTEDFLKNFHRLSLLPIEIVTIEKGGQIHFNSHEIIIDAILGSGFNRKISKELQDIIQLINDSNAKVYAVDIPTGLESDGIIHIPYAGIKAYRTITFQRPKISFLFPESNLATLYFDVVDIGLDENFIQSQNSTFSIITASDVTNLIKERLPFSHKGSYGHALIIAGNANTMGAALLTASACLNSGAGLVTASIPFEGLNALNSTWPEIMYLPRTEIEKPNSFNKYDVVAVGPGLGIGTLEAEVVLNSLKGNRPMVIDADALNIFSNNLNWLKELPGNSVLTPHVKEFDRLFGEHSNWFERVSTAIEKAKQLKVVIILKNQFTFIVVPEGRVWVNPTGNPAMAQGGMGDVLTGAITSFLAQGYSAEDASVLAVFLHGSIGDRLSEEYYVISAGKIVKELSREIKSYMKKK